MSRNSLFLGAFLHDIGKCLMRATGERKPHSQVGAEFLDKLPLKTAFPKESVECVKMHHSASEIKENSLANLVILADRLSAGADRREKDSELEELDKGINLYRPMQSIFNNLNDNKENKHFYQTTLSKDGFDFKDIPTPCDLKTDIDKNFYVEVKKKIEDNFKNENLFLLKNANSLISLLQGLWAYIPSSTNGRETQDISLFDHSKTTAAFAMCLFDYFESINEINWKSKVNAFDDFSKETCFVIASFDISGIQNFIYKTATKDALKRLRAKSVFLELFCENLSDSILDNLKLNRVNLIYSGGGHSYFLLPNTENAKNKFCDCIKQANDYLLETFDIDLFLGSGVVECSGEDLQTNYSEIISKLTEVLEKSKNTRFNAEILKTLNKSKNTRFNAEILKTLNNREQTQNEKECPHCGSIDDCENCSNFAEISKELVKEENKFFTVCHSREGGNIESQNKPFFSLPNKEYIFACTKENALQLIKNNRNKDLVRIYAKNDFFVGENLSTAILMCDSIAKNKKGDQLSTDEIANGAKGIERIAVARGDVDKLGKTFRDGFPKGKRTISRFASLSNQLSLFFKYYIRFVYKECGSSLRWCNPKQSKECSSGNFLLSVIYSGGDDFFVVGTLEDVVIFMNLLTDKFKEFTQGKLTLSAGVGIFAPNYPMLKVADFVDDLEKAAKNNERDSICLFEEQYAVKWDAFKELWKNKLPFFEKHFGGNNDNAFKGKAFLYRIMTYLKCTEKGNLKKFVLPKICYILGRMHDIFENENEYKELSDSVLKAAENSEERKKFLIGLQLFIYLSRGRENTDGV
ncbi:type III-A CRISPR-associated protein Cas10/Csm1 [Fibrobacterales bacterium]|nr:type III-A CRISPR-associated protein Cas10/Csm1 [Fibrobacterales bacterium]